MFQVSAPIAKEQHIVAKIRDFRSVTCHRESIPKMNYSDLIVILFLWNFSALPGSLKRGLYSSKNIYSRQYFHERRKLGEKSIKNLFKSIAHRSELLRQSHRSQFWFFIERYIWGIDRKSIKIGGSATRVATFLTLNIVLTKFHKITFILWDTFFPVITCAIDA